MSVLFRLLVIMTCAAPLRAAQVWVVGDLEKVHPVSGAILNKTWNSFKPDKTCRT